MAFVKLSTGKIVNVPDEEVNVEKNDIITLSSGKRFVVPKRNIFASLGLDKEVKSYPIREGGLLGGAGAQIKEHDPLAGKNGKYFLRNVSNSAAFNLPDMLAKNLGRAQINLVDLNPFTSDKEKVNRRTDLFYSDKMSS
jgi:hypothetical protein